MADRQAEFDGRYGGAQHAVLDLLGRPKQFVHCQAVLLGCGGDDGLWMRLLASGADDFHRVGSLVITKDRIGYAEKCATSAQPRSNVGLILKARKSGSSTFRYWSWSAPAADIVDVSVEPAVDSVHGVYVAVTVRLQDRQLRFGIDSGYVGGCLCALRHLNGSSLDGIRQTAGPPRTDGVYVLARHWWGESRSMDAFYFEDTRAVFFSTGDLLASLQSLRAGESPLELLPCTTQGQLYVLTDQDRWICVLDENRMIHGLSSWNNGWPGPYYIEMAFVDDAALAAGWGSLRAALVQSPWPPVVTAGGSLQAPDIR